jgi:hypothetical protein
MTGIVSYNVFGIARGHLARSATVLAAILGLGLTLGACSKCDVPTWQPGQTGPKSCHDGPAPQ